MGKKQQPEEEPGGAPEWMVTFSDCMTLLLTFFVLLLSFSSFGKQILPNLGSSFAEYLPDIGLINIAEMESVYDDPLVKHRERLDKGSESQTETQENRENFMAEKIPLDFSNLKVFRMESNKIFLGNGAVISKEGKDMLGKFAFFIRSVPSRIVISEHGQEDNSQTGMERAWSVFEYLTEDNMVDNNKVSISCGRMTELAERSARMLEITLLEKSLYE